MQKLSNWNLILVSLMLFSMFFGAGNLIFPPFLGESAGTHIWTAIAGFLITAVGFPVLGIVVVARFDGLQNLCAKVHRRFASIFSVLIYLTIGPCLAIPRAASTPYEMAIASYLPDGFSVQTGLLLFSIIFFALSFFISLYPTKLFDSLGKVMTPVLLILILLVCVMGFIHPLKGSALPIGLYKTEPFFKGFLEGYLTMDALAALNFGIIVSLNIRGLGIHSSRRVVHYSILVGVYAGLILAVVYVMLAWLGSCASGTFPRSENGAVTLSNLFFHFWGLSGTVVLIIIFFLACLTTCVGLITSCAEFFQSFTPRLSYKYWVGILTIWSLFITNFGLTRILIVSVPILNGIYPIAIILILLGLTDSLFKNNLYIYPLTVCCTAIISILEIFQDHGIMIPFVSAGIQKLPLYDIGLGWICAAAVGVILAVLIQISVCKKKAAVK